LKIRIGCKPFWRRLRKERLRDRPEKMGFRRLSTMNRMVDSRAEVFRGKGESFMFQVGNRSSTGISAVYIVIAVVVCLLAAGLVLYFYEPPAPPPEEPLTGILRAGDPRFEQYRPYVDLRNTKIQMGLNFARKRVLMISAIVANSGDQSLDVVEVTLLYFNFDKLVGQSVHTPIRPGPYTPPLEPRGERAISFYVEEFPEDWMAGHAELELSGFRFLR